MNFLDNQELLNLVGGFFVSFSGSIIGSLLYQCWANKREKASVHGLAKMVDSQCEIARLKNRATLRK